MHGGAQRPKGTVNPEPPWIVLKVADKGNGEAAMPGLTDIAFGQNKDGRLEMVATTDDPEGLGGDVWHAWQTTPNGSWTSWHPFGRPGRGAGAPVIARNADGRLEVVVVGGDQALWHRSQVAPNNGWSDWQSIGQPDAQLPMGFLVLAQNADGRLEAAVPANDDFGERAIWHASQTAPSNGWSGWASLDAPPDDFSGPLALGANADGRLELFAPEAFAGGDQEVWHRWQRTPGGDWSGWSSMGSPGGELLPDPPPALGRNADGRLELFVVASDGAIWHSWQTAPNNGWSPWSSLGSQGGGFADLGVGPNADGRLELLATLQNGTDLWRRYQTAPNNGWSPWENLGSVATGTIQSPTLASDADERLELFLRTPDTGGLYQVSQKSPNGDWEARQSWRPPS
jgi:hypothetical protein